MKLLIHYQTFEVWKWIRNFISHYWAYDYLSMLGLKLIHVSKKQPRFPNSGATLSVDMGLTAHDTFHIFLAISGLNFDGSYDIIQNNSSDVPKRMFCGLHYSDTLMSMQASQITSLIIVYSSVCSGVDQIKHQSSTSLAFVRWIHWWPVNSLHKGPVTRKIFPIWCVIMITLLIVQTERLYGEKLPQQKWCYWQI